jgi:hypothetical protein
VKQKNHGPITTLRKFGCVCEIVVTGVYAKIEILAKWGAKINIRIKEVLRVLEIMRREI